LFKLHKTLCVFQLDDGNAEDIIALARYAYSEEGGGGGLDEGPEEFGVSVYGYKCGGLVFQ
jgi:hypothetical protein